MSAKGQLNKPEIFCKCGHPIDLHEYEKDVADWRCHGIICACELAPSDVAAAELAAMREVLRRYVIYEELYNGYEILAAEFGACEHPESSEWMTEWLERVLRNPAKAALKEGG